MLFSLKEYFILQRIPLLLLLSHDVDDCDVAFEVSLSNVESTFMIIKTIINKRFINVEPSYILPALAAYHEL